MRVIITLDRYDGAQGKQLTLDLAEISLNQLTFYLMEASVCGVTITKDKPLATVCERLMKEDTK
ncbi:hypothetical protein NL64_06300 [Pseudomonas fluorescens]|uniref:hypothetical protein n=1 Tax=Pseudomonas fluorescens TaxID=294 RepID=UPI00054C51F5|nr:hypothetical protein [Pseudomonas fluorescens]KII34869.1 hypothetical protein NL64_06300 [Pseudomonas fluorescens]